MKAQGSSVLRRQFVQGMAASDRRAAAIHEAGHLIIARHLGMTDGWATIFPTEIGSLLSKVWRGNFSYNLAELDELTTEEQAMFAVAGMVAEAVWSEGLSGGSGLLARRDDGPRVHVRHRLGRNRM